MKTPPDPSSGAPASLLAAGALLDAVAPHLHEGIIPGPSFDTIRTVASLLPPLSGMGLELHLAVPVQRTDFTVRVTRLEAQRMASGDPSDPAFATPQGSSKWNPIREFMRVWADPANGALDSVENVCLEFDIRGSFATDSTPSIFFDIDRKGSLSITQRMAAVSFAFQALDQRADPALLDHLRLCADLAVPELRLYFIGLMLSRATKAVRVCVLADHASAILPYLRRIGWRGDCDGLSALLARYSVGADRFVLNLDISARTHEAVGIEVFQSSNRNWKDFFSLLERDSLCRPEEALAILSWPGRSRCRESSGDRRASRIETVETVGRAERVERHNVRSLIRRINHVKLSYGPSGEVRAKAYLYFCQA